MSPAIEDFYQKPHPDLKEAWYKAAAESQKKVNLQATIDEAIAILQSPEYCDVHTLREALMYLFEEEGLCNRTPTKDENEPNPIE